MAKSKWGELEGKLSKALTENRYRHTLGVTYTACALAMRYDADLEKARMAGLLHDCAKCMSNSEMRKLSKQAKLPVTDFELQNPALLHSKVGVYVAKTEYGVSDPAVLEAINWHTTGKPAMSMLEKIVFVADYIEPNRNKAPHLDELRHLAFEDINRCVYRILSDTIEYLSENPKSMDSMTVTAWHYYEQYR